MRRCLARRPGVVRRGLFAALLAVWLMVVHGLPAMGSFNSSPSAPSMTISSATLAAPTNLTATCLTGLSVRLNWTPTSSTWADGYEVFRGTSNGGPYSSRKTVSGQGTSTTTDSALVGTFYYVLQSTKNNWRSVNSNQAQVTVVVLCL